MSRGSPIDRRTAITGLTAAVAGAALPAGYESAPLSDQERERLAYLNAERIFALRS